MAATPKFTPDQFAIDGGSLYTGDTYRCALDAAIARDGGSFSSEELAAYKQQFGAKPTAHPAALGAQGSAEPLVDTAMPLVPQPDSLAKTAEKTAEEAIAPGKSKALTFFTHDAEGIFSAGRTAISAAIVATLAFTTAAIVRQNRHARDAAHNADIGRN